MFHKSFVYQSVSVSKKQLKSRSESMKCNIFADQQVIYLKILHEISLIEVSPLARLSTHSKMKNTV